MLGKKHFEVKTVNGVLMGNGSISIKGVHLNVHSFFIDGILIDAGARSLEKHFIPFFKELKIDQAILTHYHEDHSGCASFLQKELSIPIYMNNLMIDSCKKKADYPLYRQLFWGKRRPFTAQPITDSFQSSGALWQVINTPGHAADHLAFLNTETGQLFTGDLYCQEKTKVVLREEHVPDIIASLKRVLTYDFEDVFCSHAGYMREGRDALTRKLEYVLNLEGTILKFHEEGKSVEEINHELFPKTYPITRFSRGEWHSIHIVRSVISQNKVAVKS
ncbi:MBL fold metallo-hydrolase [Alkalihalophilus pseudofirmus]|uniref:MBL fold metallo-hydrolase n=1 Tax=Alkalihalophilus pseudofirmus TaxID=79885 RepID=UPI00259BA7D6|nr:MBL fold metallo-hydrolase [Alkalihalophilus pseudofirmus]WEG18821.1 MBL fold metallo-hydrolase [Alkalihalophilus pseudofirmus]